MTPTATATATAPALTNYQGYTVYEHHTQGDEGFLIVVDRHGNAFETGALEIDDALYEIDDHTGSSCPTCSSARVMENHNTGCYEACRECSTEG